MSQSVSRDDILELLSDGKWHGLSELMQATRQLAPEVASRFYIKKLNKPRRESGKQQPLSKQVAMGKRYALESRLTHMLLAGHIEKQGFGFNKQYRLLERRNEEYAQRDHQGSWGNGQQGGQDDHPNA